MNEKREEILARVKAATAISNSHKKEFEFDVNINGYEGHFKVKHPSLMDTMDIGVRRAHFLNGADSKSVDVMTDNLTFMTATLSVVILEAPKWFNLEVLDDYMVLSAIYEEYKNWNATFRRGNEQSSNTGSSETSANEGSLEHNEDVQNSNK